MTLSLTVQAAAVYALALLLSRAGTSASRRTVLICACVVVAGLPLLGFAPTWSARALESTAIPLGLGALQEPAGTGPALADPGAPVLPSVLSWIWAVGFAVAMVQLGADLLAVRRLRASAREQTGETAVSDQVDVPMVVGVLRPLVLLPVEAETWPASRRQLVLAHERAHMRGHDNLWLLLARVVACVHWFNPLAWATVAALRDACEHHADDAVLEGGADPVDYAEALLAVARSRAPGLGLAMARVSGLEKRVRAVLSGRRRAGWVGSVLGASLVVGLAVVTATASPRPVARPGLQALLEGEADRLVADWSPEGVALVVLDARTGALLGQAERGGLLRRELSPGSVLKPFVVVAALEAGIPRDHAFGDGDMASILERSSNAGAQQVATLAGREAIDDVLGRVGLSVPATLPLERLTLGEVLVTPLQLASAWTHLAGHGAISPQIAAETREMLVRAVVGEQGTGRQAAVPGVRVAGKTGTAPLAGAEGHLASFVGLVPADEPELVILVSVARPQGEATWGGVVAAPAFRRIVEGL
jgi:hypothetical protein